MEDYGDTSSVIDRGTSPLSDAQEKALALLPILPSILSITGAAITICRIRYCYKKITPQLRILLGMSLFGILTVGSFVLQPFLLPQETSHRVWASGNDATCSFSGFMFQLSISMVLYYGSWSFYFMAVVRFGVSNKRFAKRYEPWIHVVAIFFPLTTASVGAALGVYAEHDIGPVCWVSNYPRGCEADPNIHCLSPMIGWIFGGGVMVLALIAILVDNIIIFHHVKKTTNRTITSSLNARNSRKLRAVAIQGALYVCTGLFCYFPTVLLRAIEAVQPDDLGGSPERRLYPLLVMQALFLPSQNSIITLVFVGPRYFKTRASCPQWSRWRAVRYALVGGAISSNPHTNHTASPTTEIRVYDNPQQRGQQSQDEDSTTGPESTCPEM